VVGSVVAALVVAGTTISVVSRFFHQHRVETAVYTQTLTGMSIRTTTGDVRVAVGDPGSAVVVRRVLDWSFGTAGSTEDRHRRAAGHRGPLLHRLAWGRAAWTTR
jgi:hypothetical protein